MIKIDFTKAGKYKSKEWLAMEEKLRINEGKVDYFRSANGSLPSIVKRGRLYHGKYMVYQQKGWGISEGSTNYYFKVGKYFKSYHNNSLKGGYYNRIMRKFKIPLLKRK